jgi:hypothetical protein
MGLVSLETSYIACDSLCVSTSITWSVKQFRRFWESVLLPLILFPIPFSFFPPSFSFSFPPFPYSFFYYELHYYQKIAIFVDDLDHGGHHFGSARNCILFDYRARNS